MCSSQWLDIFLHCPWEQLWWVLTNLIDFLVLLSPLGVCLFHSWPICNVSLLLGMFVVKLVQVPVAIVISVKGVVPMEVSSCANCESCSFSSSVSFVSIFYFSLWWGGLKVSGSTFSAIILSMVILCIVAASLFAEDCNIASMGGSRCPTYSPLLNVMCLLV